MACEDNLSEWQKWVISLWMALIFIIIASPFTFQLTNAVFSPIGLPTVNSNGMPTVSGLIIHAIVFGLLTRLVMLVPMPGRKKDTVED